MDRRLFLTATLAAFAGTMSGPSFAGNAPFPERKFKAYIPTRAGGGAERNFRAFAGVWAKHLGRPFEPAFLPGAAGRVGYETYMARASTDGHDMIFGNMGPEVLNWVVKPPTFDPGEVIYFLRLDADPGCIFVTGQGRLRTLEDVIAAGRKSALNVATSRLAHPASLAILLLAEKTGMKINLIPYSGGRNTRNAVLTGETELGVLPVTPVMEREGISVVGLFDDRNVVPDRITDAILINTAYDLGIPPLAAGARAFAMKREFIEKYPDRFELLMKTAKSALADPAYKQAVLASKAPWEMITPGFSDDCAAYVRDVTELGIRYRDLLVGA